MATTKEKILAGLEETPETDAYQNKSAYSAPDDNESADTPAYDRKATIGTALESGPETSVDNTVQQNAPSVDTDPMNKLTSPVAFNDKPAKKHLDFYTTFQDKKRQDERERKKQERRERARKIIGALGDGISSLANLYFTTKGAPNAITKDTPTLLGAMKKHYDELEKKKNADEERQFRRDYMLLKEQGNEQRAKDLLDLRLQQLEAKKAEGEAKRAAREAELTEQFNRKKALQDDRVASNERIADARNATSRANTYTRTYGNSGGKYYGTWNGQPYETQKDYENAMVDDLNKAKISLTEEISNGKGRKTIRKKSDRELKIEFDRWKAQQEQEQQAQPTQKKSPTNGKKSPTK